MAASRVAKWDGSSWSALGGGMDNPVNALAVDGNGNVYAGGSFSTAGGNPASNVAKWDGSSWSALGSGTNGFVNAPAFDGSGNLYAGGFFSTAGGVAANNVAKWDGSSWSALGSGTNGFVNVNALAFDGSGNLYAGGEFTIAGAKPSSRIARWDNTGMLEVLKDVDPDDPTTYWAIEVSGATSFADTLSGDDTTGVREVISGTYTITETAGLDTDLANYNSIYACTVNGAAGPSGSGTVIADIDVGVNVAVRCTFTNTRKTATLTVIKALDPTADAGRFIMQADGVSGLEAGHGATVTTTVDVGATAYFTETAGTATDLANYATT